MDTALGHDGPFITIPLQRLGARHQVSVATRPPSPVRHGLGFMTRLPSRGISNMNPHDENLESSSAWVFAYLSWGIGRSIQSVPGSSAVKESNSEAGT
jgi:hypothetical protein